MTTILTNEGTGCIELEELTCDGTVVGRAVLEPKGREGWLSLVVAPEARGQRLACLLLDRALEIARQHDLDVVRMAFDRGDPAALGLIRGCSCPARIHASGTTVVAELSTLPDVPVITPAEPVIIDQRLRPSQCTPHPHFVAQVARSAPPTTPAT